MRDTVIVYFFTTGNLRCIDGLKHAHSYQLSETQRQFVFLLILNKPSKNELTVANTHWVKHESYITFSLTFRCRAIILFYFIFSTGTRQLIQEQVDGDKHTWCETQTLHRIITRWKLEFKKTISFVFLSVERHPSMIELLTSNNHTVKHKHEHPCSKTFYPSPMIITLNIN